MDLLTLPNYILVSLLGIAVGSFLNVCIVRIPAGQSIVAGASHCMSCGGRLKWWMLIPLLSYAALRGKCGYCKTAVSVQYPLIEAANGGLWLLAYTRFGFTADMALACLFSSVLLVIAVIDARTRIIPPGTTLAAAVLGAVRLFLHLGQWRSHVLGLVTVSGVLLVILLLSGGTAIGGGDFKLMAGTGLFLGFWLNLLGFFFGCLFGSVIHLVRMRFFGAARDLALGPYLAAGALVSLFWGDALISWYLNTILF